MTGTANGHEARFDPGALRDAVDKHTPDTVRFLQELIRIPSLPGNERDAMEFLAGAFAGFALDVERVPLANTLRDDPDYSDPVPDIDYTGRSNLRLVRRGTGGGRRLLFNTHVDVVPPSPGMAEPWSGRIDDGKVYGRGACDAKGQIAALHLALRAAEEMGRPPGDLVAHLVVEEENGGNGTLAMIRQGEKADGCIVLEPCEGKVLTSIRGAVWFRIVFRGTAGHSGQAGRTRSALLLARDAIAALEAYHASLLAASRGDPLFDPFPNPMPITFGRLQAGNWPASAPNEAVLEGVLGFLPNRTKEQVCEEMRGVLERAPGLEGGFDLSFMYRHDSSVCAPDAALPRALVCAGEALGNRPEISAMPASCDAWFYNNGLGIPTVVTGPGTLGVAHSKEEHIGIGDIAQSACVLLGAALDFCASK